MPTVSPEVRRWIALLASGSHCRRGFREGRPAETMVDLAYAALYFGDFAMAEEVSGLEDRMNDLVPSARGEGHVECQGHNRYDPAVDPVEVRRRIGMVFQKPNPFPKSIFDNVAFGPRINGFDGDIAELVEESLKQAAL